MKTKRTNEGIQLREPMANTPRPKADIRQPMTNTPRPIKSHADLAAFMKQNGVTAVSREGGGVTITVGGHESQVRKQVENVFGAIHDHAVKTKISPHDRLFVRNRLELTANPKTGEIRLNVKKAKHYTPELETLVTKAAKKYVDDLAAALAKHRL